MKPQKLTIVGGGSTYTLGMINSLIAEKEAFPLSKITFYDIDEQRQASNAKATEILLREAYPEVEEFVYTTDKETAFSDADFFFIQIRTGGLPMRERDEQIPLFYGCVGQETCGAGGMAYGLRSIGDMITLVNDIRHFAPDAWILNYTNPAAIVAEALQREFPHDNRILNICDMPAAIMVSYAQLLGCEIWDLVPEYFGLNHFGWFTKVRNREGVDLTDEIKRIILEEGISAVDPEIADDPSWQATFKNMQTMLKDNPQYLPNTYLQYYLYPEKMVEKEDIANTRARQVINGREKRVFSLNERIIAAGTTANEHLHADIHGRYMVRVAASLAYNRGETYLVIVPNDGAIPNIQNDAMVEVPAALTNDGPKRFAVGTIPTFQKALIEGQLGYEKLVVDAWFSGDRQTLVNALTLNRTVVDVPKAQQIVDELLRVNGDYLPQFH
ncbi:6-phospho-alpha-glucosidase [Salinivibrio sp. VYel9]|nr:6-phospho-alpha-glucosidase [Salinivibrio sp. VYel7]MPX94579.1 6-phospho-alpha-glucosidase [Salinivibrio sp. VYel9]MPX97384.1 6-phospho-alpha-glucosidase [Salinivibrio sp. VYel6]MPY00866.1 6-phospho-alpha-glucosidase [Salinivibrio sp. VYel4]MPY03878.1 6-phospho-alpha-glucosidase [Salinivibrio sp. VYel5]MPY06845.1 6-phospho-alpha-glucosidase [Salinivibrio sp. VYel8]MPY14819.1 6-phospho-alpha-glucosidase [Salinivibrio sp. VGrn1]